MAFKDITVDDVNLRYHRTTLRAFIAYHIYSSAHTTDGGGLFDELDG
jgi:hypothetical protein